MILDWFLTIINRRYRRIVVVSIYRIKGRKLVGSIGSIPPCITSYPRDLPQNGIIVINRVLAAKAVIRGSAAVCFSSNCLSKTNVRSLIAECSTATHFLDNSCLTSSSSVTS